jgi:cell division protein FtsL
MGRLSFLLAVALMVSAMALVTSQYQARRLFVQMERGKTEARELDVQWRQLQLDQTANAKHSLIDDVSRNQLKMEAVTPGHTVYLARPRDGAGAPAIVSGAPLTGALQ